VRKQSRIIITPTVTTHHITYFLKALLLAAAAAAKRAVAVGFRAQDLGFRVIGFRVSQGLRV
jgi:hypothetical protein